MYREMSVGVSENIGISFKCFSPLLQTWGDPLKVICGQKTVDWPPMAQVPSVLVMTAGHDHMKFSLARGLKASTLR